MPRRFVRTITQVLAALGVTLFVIAVARAVPDFQTDLFVRYPNATSLGCSACHTDPASGVLNAFGQSYLENGLAFTPALEALDSDGDGISNGEELKYSPASNPGDAQSKPGSAPPPAPPGQPAGEGAALWGTYCASCHGALATTPKRGATPARTQGAIAGNVGGMGYLSMLTATQVEAIASALSAAVTGGVSSSNYTGLWWNPAESGWGINLNHQGDTIFAALFTYDGAGAPMWLVMSAGTKQADGRTYSGTLYRTRGPAFDAVPFTPIGPSNLTTVGSLSLAFDSAASATLTYSVNGATVVKRIEPQVFGPAAAVCAPSTGSRAGLANYQDLWWNPAESGWGVTIAHQADTLFAAIFTYDASGRDLWLVMSQGTRQADGTWRGDLYRTRGPAFNAQPFRPIAAADVAKVGEARFAFSDGVTGRLDFSVDGKSVTRSITRQVFGSGPPACAAPSDTTQPAAGTDGPALYASYCAACHQPLASTTKGGATLARTRSAIASNAGGMGYLSSLTTAQLEAIAAALAPVVPAAPGCGGCHSVPPDSGGHRPHESRAGCDSCHGGGYGPGSVNAATHNNGVREVLAAIGWNAGAQTCTNGCHGTAAWSSAASLGCTSCHGDPPATGGHAKHGARFACSSCHGAGYGANTAGSGHRNGVTEVIASVGWNAAGRTCANGCHGTGTWSTSATLSCTSCHGAPPSTGHHRDHRERACSTCHGAGYSTTTVAAATHNNGVREVIAASGWTASTRSCTNSCHGRERW